jgi:predicted DNA-binding protein
VQLSILITEGTKAKLKELAQWQGKPLASIVEELINVKHQEISS